MVRIKILNPDNTAKLLHALIKARVGNGVNRPSNPLSSLNKIMILIYSK